MKRIIGILVALALLAPAVLTPGLAQAAGATGDICKVEVGENHILALKKDGTVWAWGKNDYGQIGCGSTETYITKPTQVLWLTDIVDISTRGDYCLALDRDGAVWAWGRNDHGQLGIGHDTDKFVPKQLPDLENIEAIYAGWLHSMAIDSSGSVWAWGQNESGQLGTGEVSGRQKSPIMLETITNVSAIAIGYRHTLFSKNGRVCATGNNAFGQLGLINGPESLSTPTEISSLYNVAAIDCGKDFSAAISNGTVYAWGRNTYGQLGDNTRTSSNIPVNTNFTNADSIECGENFVLARTNTDETIAWYGWGNNVYGQFGNGTGTYKVWNEKQTALTGWTSTNASAGSHCVAMWENGELYMCGMNQNSEMKERQLTYTTPTYLADIWDAYPIYGDENETYIFNGFDEFFTFGANERRYDCDDYAAGEGSAFRQMEDVRKLVRDDANEIEVKLTVDGKVYTRGETNKYGQLGVSTPQIQEYPAWNYVMDGVTDIATIDGVVFALDEDRVVWLWGNSASEFYTQNCADEYNINTHRPAQSNKTNVNSIRVINDTIYFYRSNDAEQVRGHVQYYPPDRTHTPQLETSLITYTATSGYQCEKFPALSTFENVADISANGGGHALILRADGTVWAIGDNAYGQLGNGTYTDSDVPVQVQGITNAVAVYAGPTHSVVCTEDYKVYVWGNNAQGQLGFREDELYFPELRRVYYTTETEVTGKWNEGSELYVSLPLHYLECADDVAFPYGFYYNSEYLELLDANAYYPDAQLTEGKYGDVEFISVSPGEILFGFDRLPTYEGTYIGTPFCMKFRVLKSKTQSLKLHTYR